jgi:hypothetical protein
MIGPDGVLEQVKAVNPVLAGDPPAFDGIRRRIARVESTAPGRRRPWLSGARHGPLALALLAGLLATAAVAYAATQLIQAGSPVRSREAFTANAGAGVAIGKTEGLLGIAAADPSGGPPWTMRVYETSRGLGCAQVGRLVNGRIGVLGQDGAFNDDGRFHPLPVQASQAEGDCVLLDGHGHAFLGVGTYGEPASGLPHECYLLGSRAAAKRCARSDPRDVFFGLLGPAARTITYTLGGQTHTIPVVGSDGAYLIVERTPAWITARGLGGGGFAGAMPGGGDSLGGKPLPQPIRKVTYADGQTCTITQNGQHNEHGASCLPPVGYTTQEIHVPNPRELASPVQVLARSGAPVSGRQGASRGPELVVSFIARIAVQSALSGYSVTLNAPETGKCRDRGEQAAAEVSRNVHAGEHVEVALSSWYANTRSLFPGCPGTAHGTVRYTIPSEDPSVGFSWGPFARRHSLLATVGRFTYHSPG